LEQETTPQVHADPAVAPRGIPGAAFALAGRLACGICSRCRNVYYRLMGVQISGYCWLRRIEIPRDHHNIRLDSCALDRDVVVLASGPESPGIKIVIGAGTYINRRTFIDAIESLVIGQNVAIGPNCYITDHDHGSADPSAPPLLQPMVSKPTRIEDQAWLGANVTVLKGVTIGRGTIVGAGSVVTKSLPAGVIAAGVPARVIRSRDDAPPAVIGRGMGVPPM
jgi:acetyltransferase-like isoleucine patch superfamily enzyme